MTPHRSIVPISGAPAAAGRPIEIGGEELIVIAGTRAVERRTSLLDISQRLANAGASIVHASTHRRTASAHFPEGLALDALDSLREAGDLTGLRTCTEVIDTRDVEVIAQRVDVILVGAASMHDRALLAEVGRAGRAVILERGAGATLHALLEGAEHVMAQGSARVILCERGIRTFERATTATLDLSAVPLLKSLTHLPVIVAPGAAGHAELVAPLACAAVAVGADALMLDVHMDSPRARDAASLDVAGVHDVVRRIRPFVRAAGRVLYGTPPTPEHFPAGVSVTTTHAVGEAQRPETTDQRAGTPAALAALRAGIEQVDRRIVELIARRVDLARNAGVVKREAGLPVIDEEQEHEVLSRVSGLADAAGLPYEQLRALQAYLIEISRRAQTDPPAPPVRPEG